MEETFSALETSMTGMESSLAAQAERITELDRVAAHLARTVVERDREIRAVREELAEARKSQEDGVRWLGAVARQVDEIRAQARGQATRIRMQALKAAASPNGHTERAQEDVFDGLVHVEVGPLDDFSQLVGFEDAAKEIGATSEISVQRFSQGRATLAMKLSEPVELLRELEERSPFEFKVRARRDTRLVLDVDDG